MSDLHRGVLESLQYSIDYNPDTQAGTWVTIPRLQIMQTNSVIPNEEAQRDTGINGAEVSAAVLNSQAWAVALKETDTWLAALKTAQDDLTPTWFKTKEFGKTARVIGGPIGCSVIVEKKALPEFGSLQMALISAQAPGAESGSTMDSAGSGS